MAEITHRPSVRIAAVGDVLLAQDPGWAELKGDFSRLLLGARETFTPCGVVLANLECTLAGDGQTVPTEPRVIAAPEMVRSISSAGINVVSLANNHMFDCLRAGFARLRKLLDEMGVAYFGAGDNITEAAAPAIMEVDGLRLAFIGAADTRSGPYQFAGPSRWGVAPLDARAMSEQIRRLRSEVHHVIVSLHWGEERFMIPSPLQVRQAREFVDAGASLVLGHHPHVLQGMEMYRGAGIVYSLGNFVAAEVGFSDGDRNVWNRTERIGCVILAELTADEVKGIRQVPTYDGPNGVEVDRSGVGQRRIDRVNRTIARKVSLRRYRLEHLRVKTIKPVFAHLRWSRLRKLRLRNIRNAMAGIIAGLRAK